MILKKPIKDVDLKDIRDLIDNSIVEGKYEYKKDMPKNDQLSKTACAFANTSGGVIIIGIEAGGALSAPKKIVGVKEQKSSFEDTITNIITSNVQLPIFPEIQVIPFEYEDKTKKEGRFVIVVRIEESYSKPHFFGGKIFMRINGQSQPIEDYNLIKQFYEMWATPLKRKLDLIINERIAKISNMQLYNQFGWISIMVCPYKTEHHLITLKNEEEIGKLRHFLINTLRSLTSEGHLTQMGYIFEMIDQPLPLHNVFEIWGNGFMEYGEKIDFVVPQTSQTTEKTEGTLISYGGIVKVLKQFMEVIKKIYSDYNYNERVRLVMYLSGIKNKYLIKQNADFHNRKIREDFLIIIRDEHFKHIEENTEDFINKILLEILQSFGVEIYEVNDSGLFVK